MVALCIVSVALLVPIGVLVSKIKSLSEEENKTELQTFDSTLSKQALQVHIEASEEAPIQMFDEAQKGAEPQADVQQDVLSAMTEREGEIPNERE